MVDRKFHPLTFKSIAKTDISILEARRPARVKFRCPTRLAATQSIDRGVYFKIAYTKLNGMFLARPANLSGGLYRLCVLLVLISFVV